MEPWASVHYNVILAHRHIVQHFAHGSLLVDGGHVWLSIAANNPHDSLGIVNLGYQIQQNLARMLDAAGQVVVKVEVAQISLALLALECFAADVAAWQLVRV